MNKPIQSALSNNVNRFNGFSTLYDESRPNPPYEVIEILQGYLGHKPKRIVDVGCGTGLSTLLWIHEAEEVIGIEPNDDMRATAESKRKQLKESEQERLQFKKALSHKLDLEPASADIITCSQSFHWMEPAPTLKEFAKVLVPGGVFAAYDCDWPPVSSFELENAYMELYDYANELAAHQTPANEQAQKWSKDHHLRNIADSGLFRYAREVVFHSRENFTAERYINLALSQGGLQTVLRSGAQEELRQEIKRFKEQVIQAFGPEPREMLLSYRMRLGVK